MESLKREDWIIVIVNSACETAIVYRFYGNDTEIKKVLVRLAEEDMKNDEENVVHRINNIDDVEVADNEMTCDVYYKEYTIHYKAQKFDSLQIQKSRMR